MAHKKGQGSSRNGRDSTAQRRGIKKFGGEAVVAGKSSPASAEPNGIQAATLAWAKINAVCTVDGNVLFDRRSPDEHRSGRSQLTQTFDLSGLSKGGHHIGSRLFCCAVLSSTERPTQVLVSDVSRRIMYACLRLRRTFRFCDHSPDARVLSCETALEHSPSCLPTNR